MIASLSGAMEEVYVAKETICKWNQQNAECSGRLFMPVEMSESPEAIKVVDVVIGIIGDWAVKTSLIDERILNGKKVILFFQDYHDPNVSIPGEIDAINDFKTRVQSLVTCISFEGRKEFQEQLYNQLQLI